MEEQNLSPFQKSDNNQLSKINDNQLENKDVGFPQASTKKSSKLPLIIVLILGLAIIVGLIFLLVSKPNLSEDELFEDLSPTQEVTMTPTPTIESVSRSGVSIQILNGTGIPGSAGNVQKDLESLGYTKIETGNAQSKENKASTVVFSSQVSQIIKDEIIKYLEENFENVITKSNSLEDFDIQVTTGYPVNFSPTTTSKITPTIKVTQTTTPTTTTTTISSPTPTTSR